MKKCTLKDCSEKYYAKGFCRKHYRALSGEYRERWKVIKSNPALYERFKKSLTKYRLSVKDETWFKNGNRRRQQKLYYKDNKRKEYLKKWKAAQAVEKKRAWGRRDNYKREFGGLRETVILRDGEKCIMCGLTRIEHYKKYKCDLIVHHINHKGRMVQKKEKDNRLENLLTVCSACHVKADVQS
jgi:hypothetical protein